MGRGWRDFVLARHGTGPAGADDGSREISFSRSGAAVTPPGVNARSGGRPNVIRTTRFTLLTWLPKSLWAQFHRSANIYFAFVSLICIIPDCPVIWESTVPFFTAVLLWTALKDLYEDIRRRRDDDAENLRFCLRYDLVERRFAKVRWRDVLVGDILLILQDEAIPADVLLVRACSGQAFISTVNLDGETNLKERHAAELLTASMDAGEEDSMRQSCILSAGSLAEEVRSVAEATVDVLLSQGLGVQLDGPKVTLTDMGRSLDFRDPSAETLELLERLKVRRPCRLMYENFAPRGCVLRNTGYMLAVAAYAGHETKARLNVACAAGKFSNMQVHLNRCVQGLVLMLILTCVYFAISKELSSGRLWDRVWGGEDAPRAWWNGNGQFLWEGFLWYWVILYQIVPISLYVCFEAMKLILGYQIHRDPQMVDERTQKGALARTADLVEEMGQVDFIFSDKTGTLTRNEMVFARCCIGGQDMGDFRADAAQADGAMPPGVGQVRALVEGTPLRLAQQQQQQQQQVGRKAEPTEVPLVGQPLDSTFVDKGDQRPEEPRWADELCVQGMEVRWFFYCLVVCHTGQVDADAGGKLIFSGSSPDEVAFLDAAHAVGVSFSARRRLAGTSAWEHEIRGPAGEGSTVFTVLAEIPFTSDRKRMTSVCRYKGEFFCICKGADSVMEPLLDEPIDKQTAEQLACYSELGLRTLAIASKVVPRDFIEGWQQRFAAALAAQEGREEAIAEAAAEVEHSLLLSGITAIEDRLQEGVPEAIVTIKAAGIRFWVLTGDKTETAVEIVRACQLFTEDMPLAYMTKCKDADHAMSLMADADTTLKGSDRGGLVLDGTFVTHVMQSEQGRKVLYELAMASRACVCCRLSPQQKRKLVELVKEFNKQGISMAVGDGANDVAMIQGAHVGIGIRGKEGNQAVQASDVVISQFRFLVPLLLCHGRRAYRRISVFLCYVIYKHVVLATGDLWWAHQYRFRADNAYPEMLSSAYPALLTALPMIVVFAFDRDLPDEVANRHPELHREGIERMRFNGKIFSFWVLSGVWHGSIAWEVPNWHVGSWDPFVPEEVKDDAGARTPRDFWLASCCSFVIVVTCVNLRLWMVALNPWSKPVLLVFLLTFTLLIATVAFFCEFSYGETWQPEIRGAFDIMFFGEGWDYRAVMLLTPCALLLDLAVIQALVWFRPMPLDIVRRQLRSGGKAEPVVDTQ